MRGEARAVFKDPVTDAGKRSKPGRLALVRGANGGLTTVPAAQGVEDELVEVFRDGVVARRFAFADIRSRARKGSPGPPA